MKIQGILLLALLSAGRALPSQLFDASRLELKTYAELKGAIEASSKALLDKIAAEDWQAVYQFTGSSIRDVISERQFIERSDHKAAVSSSISFADKVMIVEEDGPAITVYCQAIYCEESTSGTKLFHALTWRFDAASRKWFCVNLPFERFKFLPMRLRFRI